MKPKIVVLDGYVANPGDLSWDALAALGDLTVYDRTAPADVVARAAGADAAFTNKVVLDAAAIEALPSLRFIGVLATGYNNVDIVAARRAGIDVCNVPAYSTHSVAQLVFAHILQIANHVGRHSTSVKKGGWQHCQDFSYRLTPIIELAGLTIGIYGLGNIGKEVAKIASAFSMRVVALTSKMQYELPEYITAVDRDTLFREADILVLAAPLTKENARFVNDRTLALMKPSAIVINTARGGLVDSTALARALDSGRLYAAGVDVLDQEPPRSDEPLLSCSGCYITPHVAWQSDVARRSLLEVSAANLAAFLQGRPQNVVN